MWVHLARAQNGLLGKYMRVDSAKCGIGGLGSSCGLHLERTQDSFRSYWYFLDFARVRLDDKAVIVKTEVQPFIHFKQEAWNTVGYDCAGAIVLDSNRVQLFPQSLLSCNTAEREELDVTGCISATIWIIRSKTSCYMRQQLLSRYFPNSQANLLKYVPRIYIYI